MRRRLALAGLGMTVGLLPIVPGGAGRAGAAAPGPAVFAAGAEAWAYSAEIGVPGPLGPLASHTTVAIDNSPHAQGAAGLADPGYLIRAAAQLVAGVPTPAYCESAWPEGPDHTDCGAPGGAAAVSRTGSGAGPDATATAGLGNAVVGGGAPALTIAAQSTTSSAALGSDSVLHARADVTLSGVAVAGGALRIGTLAVHREAAATGLPGGGLTTTGVSLGGATVVGTPVAPGAHPVRSLIDATRKAFGDKIVVEALGGRQETSPDGKLVADSSGLQITWRPQPDRSVRIVLGYGRVLVYATPPRPAPADVGVPGIGETAPGGGAADTGAYSTAPGAAPATEPGLTGLPGSGPGPGPPAAAAASSAPAVTATPVEAGPPAGEAPNVTGTAAPPPLVPIGRPLAAPARPPVRWVSPFLVLAQMTTGRQVGWFLLGIAPLILAAWLSRRSGMGLLAPWTNRGAGRGEGP